MSGSTDLDTSETNEWLDSLRAVLHHQGPARAALRMFNVLNSIDLSYYGAIGCITP
jgi:pyruvate dehydrogenase complex dehydrogenase (E1) component